MVGGFAPWKLLTAVNQAFPLSESQQQLLLREAYSGEKRSPLVLFFWLFVDVVKGGTERG